MYDPRWDDPRERDDGRARVYDERDRADHDPRDGLMHDLDLPRGEARELVVDRERMHELNGEDSRAMAVVGAFRVVPERDLESDRGDVPDRDTIDHLRHEGLIRTIPLDEHDQAVVLTDHGRDLLDANRRGRDEGESQAFYAGVNRPRELDHDAHLYAAYRDEEEIRRWAQDHELPYFDDRVHFPDFRIEYDVDGREHHQDVEVLTQHYRGGHAAGRARAGFRLYSVHTEAAAGPPRFPVSRKSSCDERQALERRLRQRAGRARQRAAPIRLH